MKFLYSNIFIISQVDKSSAADTVDFGSITGLVKPKLENSLHLHSASRLDTSNKMGSVKLSPCVVDRRANDSLFSKNKRLFCCLYNLANKNAITSNLRKKLLKCGGRSVKSSKC